MAVVINEFEVMADTRPTEPARPEAPPDTAAQPIATAAFANALRTLEVRSLRAWAH